MYPKLILDAVDALDHTKFSLSDLSSQNTLFIDVLVKVGMFRSKREAHQRWNADRPSLNGVPVTAGHVLSVSDLLVGKLGLFKVGQKKWHVGIWS